MDNIAKIIRHDAEGIVSRVNLSQLEGKVIVVTGASGLIGTYVLACLDVFGKCKAVVKFAQNEPHPDHPASHFCKKWIWAAQDLAVRKLDWMFPDHLFYAAGFGQPAKFTAKPVTTIGLNTTGLISALNAMHDGGRALFVSTSEIYSGHLKPPFCEHEVGTTTPQHPRGCYIEAKRCGEAICHGYNIEHPSRLATAARVALAYGPGTKKDDDRAINQFIRQAIVERKITLKDAGQVIRNYCYISDAVEFMLNIWLHGKYEVYNVGGKSKVTIASLARKIGEICDVPVEIPSTMSDLAAPDNVTLDMRQAEGEFGKTTYVPLDDGLRRTIEWQRILYGQV
ncbi:MAG: NAD-dependent epimerase/dehydratase family protein [Azonexus sp.]